MTKKLSLAEEMTEANGLDVEINQAYIDIVGEDYAKEEEAAEAYQGQFSSDEEFAQNMAEELGDIPRAGASPWPLYCIDWEYAAKELMYDYSEDSGYYFRNL